jgi:hypothetical protein
MVTFMVEQLNGHAERSLKSKIYGGSRSHKDSTSKVTGPDKIRAERNKTLFIHIDLRGVAFATVAVRFRGKIM